MDKADPRAKLEPFQALIGEWTIEMTHPMLEDAVEGAEISEVAVRLAELAHGRDGRAKGVSRGRAAARIPGPLTATGRSLRSGCLARGHARSEPAPTCPPNELLATGAGKSSSRSR
jgi:hypothetical protein